MKQVINAIFRFLPIQLLFLHFRKYQLLLIFWFIIIATISGNFASHFGAATLFLSPEYLGEINFVSMLLLGGATAVYIMSWHITTFIIHSHRIPFMGAVRQSFLHYCINNSLLPFVFLIFYSIASIRFQLFNEHADTAKVILLQLGFYLGFFFVIFLSFIYFFRVGRDLLKTVLTNITNPSRIREIIPYDTLDYDYDLINAETYLSGPFRIQHIKELETYHPRLLNSVLRRHHRNAVFATVFAFITLLLLGIFMDEPLLRIPAAAGFLILFAVMTGIIGAVKYFLKSWELIGWLMFAAILSLMVHFHVFDLRSIAYGLNYKDEQARPVYNYESLRKVFTARQYEQDKQKEIERLNTWKRSRVLQGDTSSPLVVIAISGGGSRAAYWTFHSLQYLDSVTRGRIFSNTVMVTGASGGMIGAAYWRSLHKAHQEGKIREVYDRKYLDNTGKDLLNAIIFSFASVDLISPFNKISVGGYAYTKDRGYALEQELISNTEGLLDESLSGFKEAEAEARIPMMIINGTIVNDGRKLLISAQPVSYLTRAIGDATDTLHPPIDGVDFGLFFRQLDADNLRFTTALRMNATFPFILPVVRLPSKPAMNIMDAGLRDNFGVDVTSRYLGVMREWLRTNTRDVIFIQIRDTRETEVLPPSEQNTLGKMIADPVFIIQNKWEPMQSYYTEYYKDYLPYVLGHRIHFINLQYYPQKAEESAALNFHITEREKNDLYQSIYNRHNQQEIGRLRELLQQENL